MKPFIYSTTKHAKKGTGWQRGGTNVRYLYKGKVVKCEGKVPDAKWKFGEYASEDATVVIKQLRTLQFEYKFKYDHDTVFFAHYLPYTCRDYLNYMALLES